MLGEPAGPALDRRQLTLELPLPEGLQRADFMPAACNRDALDLLLRWPDWPRPVVVLHGPSGAGKSHLARIWAERAGALLLDPAMVWAPAAPLARVAGRGAVVVDDAPLAADEVLLFHLHNAVVNAGGSLLLTGEGPVAGWPVRLPDLRSRLLAAHAVAIAPPDDALLAALLVKQLADRQLKVEPNVIDFLLARMERSFAAVRALVAALDRASLRARRPLTPPLARLVLHDLAQAPDAAATP